MEVDTEVIGEMWTMMMMGMLLMMDQVNGWIHGIYGKLSHGMDEAGPRYPFPPLSEWQAKIGEIDL